MFLSSRILSNEKQKEGQDCGIDGCEDRSVEANAGMQKFRQLLQVPQRMQCCPNVGLSQH